MSYIPGAKINELYAYIATDADGTEGILAVLNPMSKVWTPLVGADAARMESYLPYAQEIARRKCAKVAYCCFHAKEIIHEDIISEGPVLEQKLKEEVKPAPEKET